MSTTREPANLPPAEWQYPSCGACGSDTDHDGDGYVCYPCGLSFGQGERGDLAAHYLDSEAETCGEACSNWWHGDDRISPGSRYECGTCALPKDHQSGHWNGCMPTSNRQASR